MFKTVIQLDSITKSGKKYSKQYIDMLKKSNKVAHAEEIREYMVDLIKLGRVKRNEVRSSLQMMIEEIF